MNEAIPVIKFVIHQIRKN